MTVVAGRLRLRLERGMTDQVGQGAEVGLPSGRHVETCPLRVFDSRQALAKQNAGPHQSVPLLLTA